MTNCTRTCWIAGALLGLLVLIFTSGVGSLRWFEGLFLGVIAAGLGGQLLIWLVCSGSKAEDSAEWQPASVPASTTVEPAVRETAAGFADLGATVQEPHSVGPSGDAQLPPVETTNDAANRNDIYGRSPDKTEAMATDVTSDGDTKISSDTSEAPVKASPETLPQTEIAADPKPKGGDKKKGDVKTKGKGKSKSKSKAKPESEGKTAEFGAKGERTGKAESMAKAVAKSKDKAKGKAAKKKSKLKPDNLKEIKGVGPKFEKLLAEHGITRFEQIAAWGESEIDRFSDVIGSGSSRIRSDDWVEQARVLAEGGATEFSKRVEKGNIY